jgi:preprotein translocase subunit SecE
MIKTRVIMIAIIVLFVLALYAIDKIIDNKGSDIDRLG